MKLEIIYKDHDPLPLKMRATEESWKFRPEVEQYAEGPDEYLSSESEHGPHLFRKTFLVADLETLIKVNNAAVAELAVRDGGINLHEFVGSEIIFNDEPSSAPAASLNVLLASRNDATHEIAGLERRIRQARNVVSGVIQRLKGSRKVFPNASVMEARRALEPMVSTGVLSESFKEE